MSTTRNSPAPTAEHDDFMKLKDAAQDIGCGERWLRDGINHGGFPHDRYGQTIWISRQQRDQIRALHRAPAKPALMKAYAARTKPRHSRAVAERPAA
jgi:hypothetical protein